MTEFAQPPAANTPRSAASQNTAKNTAKSIIGLLHPGEMGQVVAQRLGESGLRVVTALDGRSIETRARAKAAGMEDVDSLSALVHKADVILSILVPAAALETARAVAQEIAHQAREVLYVDCNAVAAQTSRAMGESLSAAGGRFVDAAIIGPPPRNPNTTRFYASGSHAAELAALAGKALDVRVIGDKIGQASALKTCYASLTKGLAALAAVQLTAAQQQSLGEVLQTELETSQPALYQWMQGFVAHMPPKAHRWIAEMEEHARAFEALQLPSGMMSGAAEVYRFVTRSQAINPTPSTTTNTDPADEKGILSAAIDRLAEATEAAETLAPPNPPLGAP